MCTNLSRRALIQCGGVYWGKYSIHFYLCNLLLYCSNKIHQNSLPKFTDFLYRKLLVFLPKNSVTLPNFTLPKFTVTEQFFCPFTVHYRYRIFRKIIYRPTPSFEHLFYRKFKILFVFSEGAWGLEWVGK